MEIAGNILNLLGLNDLQGRGTLSFVDTKNLKEVIRIVEQELFCFPFEIVPESGEIKYAQTLFGHRDSQRYIFKIDSRNSFNLEIKKILPNLPVKSLTVPNQGTFNFYFILSPEELVIFISGFSRWAEEKRQNNNTDQ